MPKRAAALSVSGLTVLYDRTTVVQDVSLSVPQGSFVAILGPNGAGKSTFVRALLGLVRKESGTVLFCGKRLAKMRGKIAYIPQKGAVDWDFPITVKELVLMGRYPHRGLFWPLTKEDREKAMYCLERVGMTAYAERQIGALSGGQQQRIFLARALTQEADIYFLDEPLSGVDHMSEEIMMRQLQEMKLQGKTVFVVHHDLNSVKNYFDFLIMLNVRLVAVGGVEEFFTPEWVEATYGRRWESS